MRPAAELRAFVVRWWEGKAGVAGGILDRLLWPAEQLFRLSVSGRNSAYDHGWLPTKFGPIPVISVGNLSVGGEGKTPLTAWLAGTLQDSGARPAVIMRGYGADEVRLHRELNPRVPVYTDRRRIRAVARAAADARGVAVLDDAFQHRALHRNVDIVVVAAETWSQAPRLLPRGRWRESFTALARADLVVITRKWVAREAALAIAAWIHERVPDVPISTCAFRLSGVAALSEPQGARRSADWLQGRSVLGVASIGDPFSFVRQVGRLDCQVELLAYPDHHEFTRRDVSDMLQRAGERAILVTRKDAVKLRGLVPASAAVFVVEQEVRFESGEEEIKKMLRAALIR